MIKFTPERLQVNPIECGAAVLGIILAYYKHDISSHRLNMLVGVSRYGSNAHALMRAAELLGLKAYAQRIIVSDLKNNQNLSILFVDNSHFVVFEGYFLGRYYINDPSVGRYSLSAQELRKRLSGVQIVLEPTRELLKNAPKEKYIDISSFAHLITGSLLGILLLYIASLLSLFLSSSPMIKLNYLAYFLIFLSILYFYLSQRNFLFTNYKLAQTQSSWILDKISHAGPGFFYTRPFGSFAKALKNLNTCEPENNYIFFSSGIFITLAINIILISWPLGIIIIFLYLIILLFSYFKTKKNLIINKSAQAFNNYPELAAMGQNERLIEQQMLITAKKIASNKLLFFTQKNFILFFIFLLIIMFFSSYLTNIQEIYFLIILSLFIHIIFYSIFFKNSNKIKHNKALLKEINEQAEFTPSSVPAKNNLYEIIDGFFIYPGEQEPVFKKYSLQIETNKIYAIKSAPMAGASTLLKLIGQKLWWTAGVQALKNQQLRIGLIDDSAELFEGSLLENLNLFNNSISEHDVVSVLKQASIEELFYERPMGLLAPINAHGTNISGGQKKRLLLARALLHKPDLILLDDFFDTLEINLSKKIIANLRNNNYTVIFTSQRQEELVLADKIINLGQTYA